MVNSPSPVIAAAAVLCLIEPVPIAVILLFSATINFVVCGYDLKLLLLLLPTTNCWLTWADRFLLR